MILIPMIDLSKYKLSVIQKRVDCVQRNRNEYVYNKKRRHKKSAKAGKVRRNYEPVPRVWIEERPASFGNFTIAQLKEIIAEIEIYPFKEEHTFFYDKTCVFKIRLIPVEEEEEETDEANTDKP